jgi:tetratricopeptide (TPR) repeat protein
LPPAVGYLERAVAIARASGRPNSAAEFNAGFLQLELGRWRAAAKMFEASLETSERVAGKHSRDAAESALFLSVAWIAAGEYDRARPMLQRSIEDARTSGSPSLTTALCHAVRLALHDGDLARAHTLLDEANSLPPSNGALRKLAAAEIARADTGCTAARPLLLEALATAVEDDRHMVRSVAVVDLAECEAAAGDVRAARERLEAELAWLTSAGADDIAAAPARKALAKLGR